MTPHMEAIAFRIWQVAEPKGWDLTVSEAARCAGMHFQSAFRAVKAKGWLTRFRTTEADFNIPAIDIPATQAARADVKYHLGVGVWHQ